MDRRRTVLRSVSHARLFGSARFSFRGPVVLWAFQAQHIRAINTLQADTMLYYSAVFHLAGCATQCAAPRLFAQLK